MMTSYKPIFGKKFYSVSAASPGFSIFSQSDRVLLNCYEKWFVGLCELRISRRGLKSNLNFKHTYAHALGVSLENFL